MAAAVDAVLRKVILAAAASPRIQRFVRRYGMRLGAGRFVAGQSLDEAVPVLRSLNERGLRTNTTLLGEEIRSVAEAKQIVGSYEYVLERIAAESLRTNVALKLTHLGLTLDEELAFTNVARLVSLADEHGNFIRIDMEESSHVDATLRIYRRLRESSHDNVGVVLQSYLYRTDTDLESILPLEPNVRLVKGAYLEPPEVAYPSKEDVDRAYIRQMERLLSSAGFTALATHDDSLIQEAIDFALREGIGVDRFEFQMLYGVRPQLQLELVRRGYQVLVATPYGADWYPYLMRRLAERPANLLFFVRNLLRR